MLRVVALPKAIAAGVAGAAVIEGVTLAAAKVGLPTIDLVSQLSATKFHHAPAIGVVAALIAHFAIGVCWAVFYAFFFWGRFHLRPALQGLLFAILPATLAILVVYPELALMRSSAEVVRLDMAGFFAPLNAATVGSLLVSHALFGLTIGMIYRRPAGYSVGSKPAPPAPRRKGSSGPKRREGSTGFMFATGIEC